MFVKAVNGELEPWGIGKLIAQDGADCTVEYFDAPMSEPRLRTCQSSSLGRVQIPEQTRVYAFNRDLQAWQIGRLLDDHGDSQLVKFPNGQTDHLPVTNVFVRWNKAIEDPTEFLGAFISETPRFADGRAPFVRTLLEQRSVSLGMSALPSSAIDLEAHQVEVVRRVLQDPIQRYLLADEVGLGKTIEAGVLIRQCVLDDRESAFILIIVPDTLVDQWRAELAGKFFLADLLDTAVLVEPFSARDRIATHLPNATMLVIDEAHHLTTEGVVGADRLYDNLVAAAPHIERILLLSATPALHNESGFLRMLHLLDPQGYPLDGVDAFKRRIESRQALAEIVASLTPDNALYLDYTLDRLAELFPDDRLLQIQGSHLREVIARFPREDDPELIDRVTAVRDHLSEIYRLHRRVLRHRRRSVIGLTPDRNGLEIVHYRSAAVARAADIAEDWRFAEAGEQGLEPSGSSLAASMTLAEGRLGYGALVTATQAGSDLAAGVVQQSAFESAQAALAVQDRMSDRLDALVGALRTHMAPKVQFIVFCSEPATADLLAETLGDALGFPVDRHQPGAAAWLGFGDDPNRPILVCDRRAEEGLNLQGGQKVVFHYDLPWNPNRIEQRLGRADRYGSGQAVRSMTLCCDDDPLEIAWLAYLDQGLRVFDRSIASLQYLIEQTVKDLPRLLLTDGVEGVLDLLDRHGSETGLIAREIKSIDEQDALDALGAPPSEALDALSDLDDQWRDIDTSVTGWIQTTLQFERSQDPGVKSQTAPNSPGGIFRYRYLTGNRHTLVPLETFVERCRPALDLTVRQPRSRDLWTAPYTFRRHSALSRQGRAAGARILRYGDPLLTGLREITQRDERGRSTAVWRHSPGLRKTSGIDLFFRFDFIVEAEVGPAMTVLDLAGFLSSSALSSLGRRGDMALPPFFHTVWLDEEFEVVTDDARLALLSRPHEMEATDQGGRDFNLNPKRWTLLRDRKLPPLDDWAAVCRHARTRAEAALRALPALNEDLHLAAARAEGMDAGRLGLLQARATRPGVDTSGDQRDLELERALSAELILGIRSPRVSLDAVCATFLSDDLNVAAALARA